MSEFRGFICDACGAVCKHGINIAGDKKRAMEGGRMRYSFRIDFCDKCFAKVMEACKKDPFIPEEEVK